jgi:hypothetical protein
MHWQELSVVLLQLEVALLQGWGTTQDASPALEHEQFPLRSEMLHAPRG